MRLNPSEVTHVVIHTAAAARLSKGKLIAVDQTAKTIDDYHRNTKGWDAIGYHFWIRMNGMVEKGRPIDEIGSHVKGFNSHSIGIACAGHGDVQPFTDAQWKAAVETAYKVLKHYKLVDEFLRNPMRVIGHREINVLRAKGVTDAPATFKTCPGLQVDMRKFRRDLVAYARKQK